MLKQLPSIVEEKIFARLTIIKTTINAIQNIGSYPAALKATIYWICCACVGSRNVETSTDNIMCLRYMYYLV